MEFVYLACILILNLGRYGVISSWDLALHKNATQSSTYGHNHADRAVDGVLGRDITDGHCSHTNTGQYQAWWKVDLGEISRIKMINITYRHDYTHRLSGYYLYVTNDTAMARSNGSVDADLGHRCYHDSGHRYPSYNQSRTCAINGRYVIFYNERPNQYIPSDEGAIIELCEVQIFGCPVGRFGIDCAFTCHCAEEGCDPDSGQCDVARCQTGWRGPSCYVPSSDLAYRGHVSQSSVNVHNLSDAGNAVDGLPGEDSCSHTFPTAWPQAWWMLDLGHRREIKTINIIFSRQHKSIISGYFLYVSNSSITLYNTRAIDTAHLCYHEDYSTTDPLPYRQSHQCFVTGQYVIVYNNRSSSLPKLPAHYSPEDAVVELCDVQVFAKLALPADCMNSAFGPNCSGTCHCMSGGCNPNTGVCYVPGCQRGWTGGSCSVHGCSVGYFGTNCSNECHCRTGGCNVVNGTCVNRGCADGWRGDACNTACSSSTFGPNCKGNCHCMSGTCNPKTGACSSLGCQRGWTGETCSIHECERGYFGDNCTDECHCKTGGCNVVNGTCITRGCTEGWRGDACITACDSHNFGQDCNQICHCASSGCDSRNGNCIVHGCTEGWMGNTCSQECVGKTFGRNCNDTCHCVSHGCDRKSGICAIPGCTAGWTGDKCSQECDSHTFGRDCNRTCHCSSSDCDNRNGDCTIHGCTEGWMGNTCSQACAHSAFGRDCSQTCHCANSGCDRMNGTCFMPGCWEGWTGETCSQECTNHTFGRDCNQTCHCAYSDCDRRSGVCTIPGCTEGRRGISCSEVCDNHTFGRNCNQTCLCANSECDGRNGICTIPGCTEGWTGNTCSQECQKGHFGANCSEECHCQRPGCDHITGSCTYVGCQAGWSGGACDQQCTNHTFGRNCNQTCHCANPDCDRRNGLCYKSGCEVGWMGKTCSQEQSAETSADKSSDSSALIGGSVAAVVAVLVAILIVFIIMRKRKIPRRKKPSGSTYMPPNKNSRAGENIYVNVVNTETKKETFPEMKVTETDVDEDEVIYVNGPNDTEIRGETKILVSDLKEVVTMKHENDMYEVEFKSLPHGLKHPHKASNLPQNLQLNRFKTTFPYDHSRVILKKEQKDSTDYINANFIDGVRNQKAYIATQGPKTITLEDFWRMTWQNKCGKIIMLANLVEVGKVKCTTYWTGSDGGPLELGLFQVTLQEETEYAFYTIRKLSVKSKQTNSRRQVIQYHFTRWPDHGVPEPFELLQFYKRVKSGHTDLKGPLIVHCSAGIGRTGSYIAMDALLLEGVSSREIDVFAYVERMRKDRMNMIQTAKQYQMLHFIVLEGLNVVTTSMSKTDFCRVITDMLEGGIPRQQYEVLNAERPEYKTTDYETALKNKNKNRNQTILAVEKYKTRLMSTTSGYINAVNIPAYRTPYGYILTQHPMDNTTTDFLYLIAQERSDTVVSIGTLQNKPSWPTTKGARTKFGNFLVTTVQCDYHSVGTERVEEKQLAIENKETGTDTQITLFETPSWGMSLPESSFMLELIQVIQCRRGMDAASVIITCSDGATESGLVCTMCNVMERLEIDGDVDIMAAVRQLQIRRPQCIPNKDQYVFCYKLVKDYLEANTVYANV